MTVMCSTGSARRLAQRAVRISYAALVLAVAACGGGGGASKAIVLADFADDLQSAQCERLARCAMFPDQASCEAYFRVTQDVSLAGAVSSGKVRYDGAAASACVDQTAQQSCDLSTAAGRTAPAACIQMLAGTVNGGDPCELDAECASGTCEFPDNCPETGCCTGMCRPAPSPGAAGADCARDRDCQSGLVCSTQKQCLAPAAAGGDCRTDRECADGLGCINPLSTMPGTCRPLPHLGEACPYSRCADQNLRCDVGGTNTCVALGLPGATCRTDANCSPYMTCNTTSHQCEALPSLGMPCTTACQGASYCQLDSTTGAGVCAAPQANGAACESHSACASDYCFVGPILDSCADPPVCM
jgi:hypothetical protein